MGQEISCITQCGNVSCGESFLYQYDLASVPTGVTSYLVICPHCNIQQQVLLQTRRRVEVLRGAKQRQLEIIELILPSKPIAVVGE